MSEQKKITPDQPINIDMEVMRDRLGSTQIELIMKESELKAVTEEMQRLQAALEAKNRG